MIVQWSSRARADRKNQLGVVAAENTSAAIQLVDRIQIVTRQLVDFPEIGRPGRKRGTRELVITGTHFLAIYRVSLRTNRVEIVRFLHGAQQWPPRSKTR